jgi:hypothetical protein
MLPSSHGRLASIGRRRNRSFLSLMSDPPPYGMAVNRPSIEALVTYSQFAAGIDSIAAAARQVFVDINP